VLIAGPAGRDAVGGEAIVTGLGAEIGQRIEEDGYPRLATVTGAIEFVASAGGQPVARST
jgi:hypothetical protein